MAALILGPLLRYAGPTDATVWVETDAACEATVLGHGARTFCVEGHHYAIVRLKDLEPGTCTEYTVELDGRRVWPQADAPFPPSVIRTPAPGAPFRLVFGSCRVCAPHEPPWTLRKDEDERGREVDALRALALRMLAEERRRWPDALLMLGDQIYADEVSIDTREFIRRRRDVTQPPGEEVADFEEYTHLYRDTWGEPVTRWLLSTVPSVMIFDDHDVNDDWNISAAWVRDARAQSWWEERITGGFMSYWIYQHLGNLSPRELEDDPMFAAVRQQDDAGHLLRAFAHRADREPGTCRWSVYRDFGRTRLIVMDSRAGRVLEEGRRRMIDADEWAWIEDRARGEFDHLLLGTSLPFIMGPGVHFLEAWNEAVCAGAWGRLAARLGERLRRKLDLEHWSAFGGSFAGLRQMIRSVASGEHCSAPASIVVLSGDVHHAYVAALEFSGGVTSPVYQLTCSPMRNSLDRLERFVVRSGWSRSWTLAWQCLAWLAGVRSSGLDWRLLHEEPWFDNQIATLELDGRKGVFRLEKTARDAHEARLENVFCGSMPD
ncbi:MAG TPA: alkaline phosphatase D family protein [Gammaproteobacteria bacterium]|nr:alkaline phosphatase D family protein [Gammaproteobacteria bacterium]